MMHNPPKEQHEHADIKFPKGFLWGAATSAHQVEGQNIHNDWWEWESLPGRAKSGQAADQYHLYQQDFDLAKSLGHNAHRLSIEWSRIEPKEGQFSQKEIDHYKKVLSALKERDIKVMLTLWHFTLPKWLADIGGWENGQTPQYFARFVQKIVPHFKDYVDFYITINEPDIYVYMLYSAKLWPCPNSGFLGQIKTYLNLVSAHKKAYKILKKFSSHTLLGVALNMQSYEAYHKHSIRETLAAIFSDLVANHLFLFLTRGFHDFLGINYYFHRRYKIGKSFLPEVVDVKRQARDVSDLGWEINPEGLFDTLTDQANDLPIYITECGIASTNDDRRTRFLLTYLQEVYRAIQSGAPVKGFFYWSLMDNFEWHQGFDPRFGLVEVDFKTQKRTPRPSAYVYQEIIKHNGIPHKLLKLLGHGLNVEEELKEVVEKDLI